ncbi:hypothetical protein O181_016777 [Austropuccinia psidii MF-1]|uniref:Uncharacterized protein n=1 Tax=Austropuccinia psidii MF-1 TaxID=1389203 RepID=A0A9Q3C6D4_9BASI|nr:hypothetical protein [Austropuccinia psidii MF-1]
MYSKCHYNSPSTSLKERHSQCDQSSVNPTQSCTQTSKSVVVISPPLQPVMAFQESFSFTSPISEVTSSQCKKSSANPSEPLDNVESTSATIFLLSKPKMLPPKNSNIKSFCINSPSISGTAFRRNASQHQAMTSSYANPTDAPLQKLEKKVRFTGLDQTKQGQSMESTSSSEILTLPLKQSQYTPTCLPESSSSGSGSYGSKILGSSKLSTTHANHEKGVVYSSEDEELEATQKILSEFLGEHGPQLEPHSQKQKENPTDSATKCPHDATSVPPPISSNSSQSLAIDADKTVLPIRPIASLQKHIPAPPVLQNTLTILGPPLLPSSLRTPTLIHSPYLLKDNITPSFPTYPPLFLRNCCLNQHSKMLLALQQRQRLSLQAPRMVHLNL